MFFLFKNLLFIIYTHGHAGMQNEMDFFLAFVIGTGVNNAG